MSRRCVLAGAAACAAILLCVVFLSGPPAPAPALLPRTLVRNTTRRPLADHAHAPRAPDPMDYEEQYARAGPLAPLPPALTFWSTDMHISPVDSLKAALARLNGTYRVIDKSLSGHCHLKGTCARDLRVLSRANAERLGGCDESLKQRFYDAYRDDPEMRAVDVFVCQHAAELAELYMAFAHGRALYVSVSTRFDFGRDHDPGATRRWANNLRRIAQSRSNVIAANNRFDQMYMYYYTGIMPLWVPDLCAYVVDRYAPSRPEILVMQDHGKGLPILIAGLEEARRSAGADLQFRKVRDLYAHYEYADLARHRAAIAIPYQVSVMKYFELYWMGIPLMMPSRAFYARLHIDHGVVNQLTWQHAYTDIPASGSRAPRHPRAAELPDPQAEHSWESMYHWLGYADWYQWENTVLFDSWADAVHKARTVDFAAVSRAMLDENQGRLRAYDSRIAWMLARMAGSVAQNRTLPPTQRESMCMLYGDDYFTDDHVGPC